MDLSKKELSEALAAISKLESLGLDCRELRDRVELSHSYLTEGIQHAVAHGDTTSVTGYLRHVKATKGHDKACALIAYIVRHTNLTYCPSRGIITTTKGVERSAESDLPVWEAWLIGRDSEIRELMRPFVRKCDKCGVIMNSVQNPGSIENHHCQPFIPGAPHADIDERSSSIRAFSGGGGPGTGKRR